jgi:hypothetical protein
MYADAQPLCRIFSVNLISLPKSKHTSTLHAQIFSAITPLLQSHHFKDVPDEIRLKRQPFYSHVNVNPSLQFWLSLMTCNSRI